MTETNVRPLRTSISANDTFAAIRDAWRAQVSSDPTDEQLLVLLSQVWLETASGTACYNNNLGGIKHVNGDGHAFYVERTTEVINGKTVPMDCPFRAYATLAEGASDYLHLIRTTFGYAWPAVEAVDLEDFAHRLHTRGYYTSDEHDYAAGLKVRFKQLQSQIEAPTPPEPVAHDQPAPGTDDDEQPTPPDDIDPAA